MIRFGFFFAIPFTVALVYTNACNKTTPSQTLEVKEGPSLSAEHAEAAVNAVALELLKPGYTYKGKRAVRLEGGDKTETFSIGQSETGDVVVTMDSFTVPNRPSIEKGANGFFKILWTVDSNKIEIGFGVCSKADAELGTSGYCSMRISARLPSGLSEINATLFAIPGSEDLLSYSLINISLPNQSMHKSAHGRLTAIPPVETKK